MGKTIVPAYASSNTEEAFESVTYQDSDTFISASKLESGKKYLVLASCIMGADTAAAMSDAEAVLSYGATQYAHVRQRARASSGNPFSMDGGNISTPYILTGDGVSDLKLQVRGSSTPGFAYIGGKSLVSVPLEDLTENTDYWYSQHNDETAEVTTVSGGYVDVRSATFTINEDGNYILLASVESNATGSTDVIGARVQIDGTTYKKAADRQRRLGSDWYTSAFSGIARLSAGSRTIKIQGAGLLGAGTKSFRRSRIVLIRCNTFETIVNQTLDDQRPISNSYNAFDTVLSRTYPHSIDEDVVIIGSLIRNSSADGRTGGMRMENISSATKFCDPMTMESRAPSDSHAHVGYAAESVTSNQTYELQVTKEAGVEDSEYHDLIIWGMTMSRKYGTADDYVDLFPALDVTTEWDSTDTTHYTEIDEGFSSPDDTDYIESDTSAGEVDEFKLGGFPSRFRFAQRMVVGIRYKGTVAVLTPGARFVLTTSLGDVLLDRYAWLVAASPTEGFFDLGVIMATKSELEGGTLKLITIDGGPEDPPDPFIVP